jgi:NADPH:quinone reductase-like Zn-dependent oxidoreductase
VKAVLHFEYGSPDVLRYEDVPDPEPGEREALVEVAATSVNPIDVHFLRGTPYVMRAASGLHRPRDPRLGLDFAGRVRAVGASVTLLRPGEEVFGASEGAWAERLCVREEKLAPKPANLTFEQAAAAPIAGLTALQALRDRGRLRPGQRVLINGASGGVGTFAVQIAKSLGAEVTAVCSTDKLELARSLGADRVVDYTAEDFTRDGRRYDLLLDLVGNRSLAACRGVLAPEGAYVAVSGRKGPWLGPLVRAFATVASAPLVRQRMAFFVASVDRRALLDLKERIEVGAVAPVVDRVYPWRELPEAVRYLERGHARGKVVVAVL